MKRCLIVGLPSAGKTTLLKLLKQRLESGALVLDLDQLIEQQEGKSCQEMILSFGWDAFRRIERDLFFDLSQRLEPMILALGGGTLSEAIEPGEISSDWIVVELDKPIPEVMKSLVALGHPLSRLNDQELVQRLEKRVRAIKTRADQSFPYPQTEAEFSQLAVAITKLLS